MKWTLLIIAVASVLLLAGWWLRRAPQVPAAITSPQSPAVEANDSMLVTRTGIVGAGGQEPLLARTSGRIRKLYFSGGEFVHRGDVLAKLYNYTYIVVPRDGFLGVKELYLGQYVSGATRVTTISRLRTLTVVLAVPPKLRHIVGPGDSVQVWVATRPARIAIGIVGPTPSNSLAADSLEILLSPGAPFRIGEQACVRRAKVHQWDNPSENSSAGLPARR